MFRIVRRNDGIRDGEDAVEFNVYRCLSDGAIVYGYMRHRPSRPRAKVLYEGSRFGIPVGDAFREACRYAQAHRIPLVVVVDPDGLFAEAGAEAAATAGQ